MMDRCLFHAHVLDMEQNARTQKLDYQNLDYFEIRFFDKHINVRYILYWYKNPQRRVVPDRKTF